VIHNISSRVACRGVASRPAAQSGSASSRISAPGSPDAPSRLDLAQNPLEWPQVDADAII
jgi:hypothetical protein